MKSEIERGGRGRVDMLCDAKFERPRPGCVPPNALPSPPRYRIL
jgi:hypothetical protein